jgi:5'-nucleotidase
MKIDGVPVDKTASYRVAMNNFLAGGGDGFTVFNEGTSPLGGEIDLDALVNYFMHNSPVAPGPQNRITRVP